MDRSLHRRQRAPGGRLFRRGIGPGGEHRRPAGLVGALSGGRPAGIAHGLARAAGAGQARRRPAHRLGLPVPGRRQARRRHRSRHRPPAGAARRSTSTDGCRTPTIFARIRHGARRRGQVLAFSIDLGKVASQPVSRYLMIAYDDLYSIEYFERRERAWWRRNGADAADLLRTGPARPRCAAGTEQGFRRRAHGRPAPGRRREVRPPGRAGLPADAGRAQAGGGRRRHGRCSSPRRTSATAASPPWT